MLACLFAFTYRPLVYTPQYNPLRLMKNNQLSLEDMKCMWYTVKQNKGAEVAHVVFNKTLRTDQEIDIFIMCGLPVACMISTRSCKCVIAEKLCIKDERLIASYNAGPLMRKQLNRIHGSPLIMMYAKGYSKFVTV